MSLQDLLQNPNFLQLLGNAGQTIGSGGSVGEALNPADIIRNVQSQQAIQQLLSQMFPQTNTQKALAPPYTGTGSATAAPYQQPQAGGLQNIANLMQGLPPVTPVGTPGLDSRTVTETADGKVTTTKEPSQQNLSTFGTTVPAEAQPLQAQKEKKLPFPQALLG